MIDYFNCQLIKACKTDNVNLFKKCKLNNQNIFLKNFIIKYYLKLACYHGSEKIVTFLIDNYWFLNLKLSIDNIIKLINKKKLNILKIIYQKKIYEFKEYSILYHSARSDLEILKWIISLSIFDLNHKNELALLNAALYQKIDILNWLIVKNCNYKINNHYIFKACCYQKKMNSVNFLCGINNFYFYKIQYLSNITNDYKVIPIIKVINDLVSNQEWYKIIDYYNISVSSINLDNECSISYTNSNFITNCQHQFYFPSFMKWYIKSKKCPLCKCEIELSNCKVIKDYYDTIKN